MERRGAKRSKQSLHSRICRVGYLHTAVLLLLTVAAAAAAGMPCCSVVVHLTCVQIWCSRVPKSAEFNSSY